LQLTNHVQLDGSVGDDLLTNAVDGLSTTEEFGEAVKKIRGRQVWHVKVGLYEVLLTGSKTFCTSSCSSLWASCQVALVSWGGRVRLDV